MSSHAGFPATADPGSRQRSTRGAGPGERTPVRPIVGTLFTNRYLDAFAKTLVCFAVSHQALLLIDGVVHRHAPAFNVFTMIEAQRLAPSLGVGTANQWLSCALALAAYGLVFAFLTHSGRATLPATESLHGVISDPLEGDRFGLGWPARAVLRPSVGNGLVVLALGVAIHMSALALIERFVDSFPGIPDVLQAHLPNVQFGLPGEICFVVFLVSYATLLMRSQPRALPAVLTMLGLLYGIRGLFLFALPIGMPPTALPLAARFSFYPYGGHGYFPGGHCGIMTIMSLSLRDTRWRRGFMTATLVFAFGTILSRAHYTADAMGGLLAGYAIVAWGRRHLGPRLHAVEPKAAAAAPADFRA